MRVWMVTPRSGDGGGCLCKEGLLRMKKSKTLKGTYCKREDLFRCIE